MKKVIKLFGAIFFLSLSASPASVLKVKAAGETEYVARAITQKSHVRYDASPETTGLDVGTNWQQSAMPDLFNIEASFVRLTLEAPSDGTYLLGVTRSTGAYPVRLYVNGTLQLEGDLGDTGWTLKRDDFPVTLAAGLNVLILQFNNWGGITHFTLPNEIKVIRHDESDGIYYTVDSKLNTTRIVTHPSETKSIHDPAAHLIPVPFRYDNDPSFNGYAEYKITPKPTTKSLKVHYRLSDVSAGSNTGIMMSINDYPTEFVALPASDTNTDLVALIKVNDLGFNFSGENKVLVSVNTTNSNKVAVTALELSDEEVGGEVPPEEIETTPITAETLKTKALLRGRQFAKDGVIVMDWSASGIDVNVSGTRVVDAVFNAPNGARITTSIDNERTTIVNVTAGNNQKVRLAENLNPLKTYLIRIYKASEAAGSLCELVSLNLENDAMISKPQQKELNFFFLGSSTSCGNQIDIEKNIDAYGAFPRVLADAYDAHFDVVSCSGRGLMQGYNSENAWAPSQENQLKHLFEKTSHFRDSAVNYDHSLVDYDVIVLSIGHNDLGVNIMQTFGTTIEDFTAEVKTFHAHVRELYPHAYILYEYGHYVNRRFNDEFSAAVAELKATDPNTGYVYTHLYGAGADSHPSYSQHESIAKDLSPQIAEFLDVENPLLPTPVRYEAEDADLTGAATKQSDTDLSTPWSNAGYVGDLGPDVGITNPNDILLDGSDVKILTFNVNAPVAGKYSFTVGYATQVDTASAYVNFDHKGWHKLSLYNTTGWKSMQETTFIELNLSAGNHTIILTGSCELGSWANYDYIELGLVDKAGTFMIYAEESEHYSFIDLPTEVIAGEDVSFKLSLHSHYSKSNVVVKVNNEVITPVEGLYTVTNVEEDLYITVEGVVKNKFVLTFKDGDTIISQTTYEVGEIVIAPPDPTKEGYTF
ncbi:MAG: Endoglucanase E precursor [Tenericutes bacterium ADurb.Bin087]|nr:MAG: Endoglucanase E precursor [Tenericutes bacterium ADurb.Bin087]